MNNQSANVIPINSLNPQRGVALVTGLIFLVLMSIIGIAAMSNVSLQEQISGNTVRKNIVFQQAEQDLAALETLLLAADIEEEDFVIMVLNDPSLALDDNALLNADNWDDCTSIDNAEKCYVSSPPSTSRAKVEYLSKDNSTSEFRVTVRTQVGKSVVTLQSIYVR